MEIRNKTINTLLLIMGTLWIISAGVYFLHSRVSVLQTAIGNNESVPLTGFQRDVEISFDFKFDTIKGEYENLFQTAAGNEGIRLEFNSHGVGLWGIVTPGKTQNTLQAVSNEYFPTPNIWHTMSIQVRNDKLELWLDGVMRNKYVLENPNFLINDVAVGTGFSRSRPFSGEIKNFQLKTNKHSRGMLLYYYGVLQVGIILLVAVILRCNHITSFRTFKDWIIAGRTSRALLLDAVSGFFLLFSMIVGTKMQFSLLQWKDLPDSWPLYYEGMATIVLFVYSLWRKAGLAHFAATAVLSGSYILLKRYYILCLTSEQGPIFYIYLL